MLSAARAITLIDAGGKPLPALMVTQGERLRVTPLGVWPTGPLTLHVAAGLEDAAGNRPGLAFEHRIGDGQDLPWAD
ncbi:hypothetical protein J4558_22630 [Leptolyngbya sp. 15MV]|nr:hypothetical protein J4558_22630 [Leptolyngbya sp. 15MV]